jgi:gliding motility-associated-like protein
MSRFTTVLTLAYTLLCQTSLAQVCSSGLGDPIVDVTFGSGTGFGPALASGITNMTYQNSGCVLDNAYEIVNSESGCYVSDWVTIPSDHTGNPNGYFMLIGASDQPSDFYVQTVNGLCGSTSYQFAAWVVNMASHAGEILPDITFSIENTDGTVIQSLETGGIPWYSTVVWQQFSFYFATPPGVTTVVLRMRNNAPGGYGNDLSLDDITFRTSGPSIGINIDGYTGDSVNLCSAAGNTVGFTGTVGACYTGNSYQWQQSADHGNTWTDIAGAVNTGYTSFPTNPGSYLFRMTAAQTGNIGNLQCRVASAVDSVVVFNTVTPGVSIALNSGHICADSSVAFTATPSAAGNGPQYQWLLNGTPVTANGLTYNTATLVNGDQVSCTLTSDTLCASPQSAASNIITVDVLPNVASSVTIESTALAVCQDSVVVFTASPANGGGAPVYQWLVNGAPVGSDSAAYSAGNLNQGDQVSVAMTSSLACSSAATSNVIDMTVYDRPDIQLTPDTVIAAHTEIVLDPVIVGAYQQLQWSPVTGMNDPTLPDPTVSPEYTTVYQLTVSNTHCASTAVEKVTVFYDLVMPNAFTPNGDGHNDLYRIPPSIPLDIRQFSIYSRWGQQVFTTKDGTQGWDGRIGGEVQPAGAYVWVIEYYNPIIKQMVMKKGTMLLIR